MKKAKLILISTYILAIAGGILAFKANRFFILVFKTTTTTNTAGAQITICKLLPGYYVIDPSAPPVASVYSTIATNTTTVPTAFCSLTLRLTVEE